MTRQYTILDRIDALIEAGRSMVESRQLHGMSIRSEFGVCSFDDWRRRVIDLLYEVGGCEDAPYQQFAQKVTRPIYGHLEAGLRILDRVREDVELDGPRLVSGVSPVRDPRVKVSARC